MNLYFFVFVVISVIRNEIYTKSVIIETLFYISSPTLWLELVKEYQAKNKQSLKLISPKIRVPV